MEGHAIGLLTDTAKDKGLSEVIRRGRKYRSYQDHHDLEKGLHEAIDEYVVKYYAAEEGTDTFGAALKDELSKRLATLPPSDEETLSRNAAQELKNLKKDLVILPVDKTTHDFGYCCKAYYATTLREQLQTSTTYEKQDTTISQLQQQHKQQLEPFKLQAQGGLPYL
ncbi:hypothetical protein DIPPA_25503 [Diplonema papillatum]|nr:hypothetical protein DIPPA_25503 [Diplonema papillatum]